MQNQSCGAQSPTPHNNSLGRCSTCRQLIRSGAFLSPCALLNTPSCRVTSMQTDLHRADRPLPRGPQTCKAHEYREIATNNTPAAHCPHHSRRQPMSTDRKPTPLYIAPRPVVVCFQSNAFAASHAWIFQPTQVHADASSGTS